MMSLVFDPSAFGDPEAFADDVIRLVEWVKAAPPIIPGGKVLLPGEIEEEIRGERISEGLPIDDVTWSDISATARSLGVAVPAE
jgi:hydroxycarboxylate dehydrogenase B